MTGAINSSDYDLHDVEFMEPESHAVSIARLQEQGKHHEHRQNVVERTLGEHMKAQNEINTKLYEVAYQSLHEIKNAKYWVSGALAAVGLMWLLVTHLDDLKKLFT